MSTNTLVKCQAKNPALCVDPNCPEKKNISQAYDHAVKQNSFDAYAKAKELEKRSSRGNTRQKAPFEPQKEVLFHKELGFPSNFSAPKGPRKLVYGPHARKAAEDDGMPLIPMINLDNMELIEMGVKREGNFNKVSKYLFRGQLDAHDDFCIVVVPGAKGEKWFVKTVWVNSRSDKHQTLDVTKYAKPKPKVAA